VCPPPHPLQSKTCPSYCDFTWMIEEWLMCRALHWKTVFTFISWGFDWFWSQSGFSIKLRQVWCGNSTSSEHTHWEWTFQWGRRRLVSRSETFQMRKKLPGGDFYITFFCRLFYTVYERVWQQREDRKLHINFGIFTRAEQLIEILLKSQYDQV